MSLSRYAGAHSHCPLTSLEGNNSGEKKAHNVPDRQTGELDRLFCFEQRWNDFKFECARGKQPVPGRLCITETVPKKIVISVFLIAPAPCLVHLEGSVTVRSLQSVRQPQMYEEENEALINRHWTLRKKGTSPVCFCPNRALNRTQLRCNLSSMTCIYSEHLKEGSGNLFWYVLSYDYSIQLGLCKCCS